MAAPHHIQPSASPSKLAAEAAETPARAPRMWAAHWGVLGVCLLFGRAILRLGVLAYEALASPLSGTLLLFTAAWIAFNAYAEGYRAFQLRFSPRIVRRSHELARSDASLLHLILAPLVAMSLIGAPRRSRIMAFTAVGLIASLVVMMRFIPQPYRGIIDAGVVVALAWGLAAMVYFHFKTLRTGELPVVAPRRRERLTDNMDSTHASRPQTDAL